MKKWIARTLIAFLALSPVAVWADYTATQGAGSTVFAFLCSTTKICPATVLIDSTNVEKATAGNPLRTDPTGTTTQPVSAASLPLPTGASTAAKQPALGTAGAASVDVLTVQGIASMTPFLTNPSTAANWGIGSSTQNSASVANGQLALAQFNTTPTTITTGNMSPLQMDSAGNLLVNIKAGAGSGGTALADNAAFTQGTTSITPIGCFFTSGTYSAITTLHAGVLSCTSAGSLHTTVDNTLTALVNNADGVAAVSSVTGTAGNSPVNSTGYLFNGTTFDRARNGRQVSALAAAVVPTPALSTWHLINATGTNATSVKGSAATLFSCQLGSIAGPAFLKIYNKATAPTVGTDVPVKTLIIPVAATAANGAGSNISFGPGGLTLSTGFAAALTTGITDADTGSTTVSTLAINCDYE